MYIFCVIIYVIIFRVLSFMISFDVIIFHGQQMLSFLCYHFLLYIFFVIIYDIIYYYHDIYIMKNDNILYTQKWQHLKNYNISTIKKITSRNSKMITFTPLKMITSCSAPTQTRTGLLEEIPRSGFQIPCLYYWAT
jgi:hypothetical protein